jgi:hypothetical protein
MPDLPHSYFLNCIFIFRIGWLLLLAPCLFVSPMPMVVASGEYYLIQSESRHMGISNRKAKQQVAIKHKTILGWYCASGRTRNFY